MAITSLSVVNFRNLAAVELSACSLTVNVISGNNGSGKTSLLEAIYYLGLGRSFRSPVAGRLIQHGKDKFSIFSQIVSNTNRQIPVGIEREENGTTRLRVAGKDVSSITELASFLPIRLINSQSHQLLESGPVFRRKYLDWGLFYHQENFLATWRSFERVLKQRNSILRDKRPKRELDVWTEELIKYGLALHQLRLEYIQALAPAVEEMTRVLLSIDNLTIDYHPGWNTKMDYADSLAIQHGEEYRLGFTTVGPHRADFDIAVGGISVRHFLSRGQQKLLICAMLLAQGMILGQRANKGLIYLVDDLPSELDLHSQQKLISLLSKQQTQVFITAIESKMICDFIGYPALPVKVFHVEHGELKAEGKQSL